MSATAARAAGALALAVALVGGCAAPSAQPPGGSATTPAGSTSSDRVGPAAPPAPTADPTGPAPAAGIDVPVRDASPEAVQAAAVVAPVRVVYPGLEIDMPVDAVGVAPDGQMEIPPDAARAGWYRFGPTAGADAGATVIASHSGSEITPRGPFHRLDRAQVGDPVVVVLADGTEVTYEVTSVEGIAKTVIDLSRYFRRDGEPELVLITCGGRWDDVRQSYDDNIVTTARLAGS
ncbi:class F sortase [Georgenia faecalis]|uniref:Class F sortase n=1 Tax=Georgenia faecalis TaxID=2483799 RepID=A0ABV9D719_9MICO|nr:class F sortase [Georgenia faecalis]